MKNVLSLIKYYQKYAVISGLVFLIVIHGLFDSEFKIDTVSILLIIIILLLPYIPLIRKIKYGDFEAEITREEVDAVKEKANEIRVEHAEPERAKTIKDELVTLDFQLALAKIRIEIEKKMRLLYQIYFPDLPDYTRRHAGIKGMMVELRKKGIVSQELYSALLDLVGLANRAIHGEEISHEKKIL